MKDVYERLNIPRYADPADVLEDVAVALFVDWVENFLPGCVNFYGEDHSDLRCLEIMAERGEDPGWQELLEAYVDIKYVLPAMEAWGAFESAFEERAGCTMAAVYPRGDNENYDRNSCVEFQVIPIERGKGRERRLMPVRRRLKPELRDLTYAYMSQQEDHISLHHRAKEAIIRNRHLIRHD